MARIGQAIPIEQSENAEFASGSEFFILFLRKVRLAQRWSGYGG